MRLFAFINIFTRPDLLKAGVKILLNNNEEIWELKCIISKVLCPFYCFQRRTGFVRSDTHLKEEPIPLPMKQADYAVQKDDEEGRWELGQFIVLIKNSILVYSS